MYFAFCPGPEGPVLLLLMLLVLVAPCAILVALIALVIRWSNKRQDARAAWTPLSEDAGSIDS